MNKPFALWTATTFICLSLTGCGGDTTDATNEAASDNRGKIDPCDGIELLSTSHFFVNTTVRVQNTNSERKLVTFSMLSNGIEVASPQLWVAARDITEAQIQNDNRLQLRIKRCE